MGGVRRRQRRAVAARPQRQFPHATTVFNLNREQLDARGPRPWAAGRPFDLSDHHFQPERAKLTIYKGPELKPEQMGMGRGWANVTRSGEEVTELLGLAGELAPGASEQERLALAAAAVQELLREEQVRVTG